MTDHIDPSLLIDRRIYRVKSRNLIIGAWSAERQGFIGIREKFGSHYLFTEYEHTASATFGTAWAMDDLGVDVPTVVQMVEHFLADGVLVTNQPLFDLLSRCEPRAIQLAREERIRLQEEYKAHEDAMSDEERAARDEAVRRSIAAIRAERQRRDADKE